MGYALLVTSTFVVFTEILQLYFNRNGRFVDVGIDFLGIMFAYFFSVMVLKCHETKKKYVFGKGIVFCVQS